MEIKPRLLAFFDQMETEEADFIERLSEAEKQASGEPDRWAAKDILAHIATWDSRLLQSIDQIAAGETPPEVEDIDKENAAIFEAHRNESWAEVSRFLRESRTALKKKVQSMSEEELYSAGHPWLEGRPIWRRILGESFDHPMLHFTMYSIDHQEVARAVQKYEEATKMLVKIDESLDWQGTTVYNLACCYSHAGQVDKAVASLKEAFNLRPDLKEWSKEDPDLNPVRSSPAFQALY